MKNILIVCIIAAVLLPLSSCGGGANENAAIEDTIRGYVAAFNAEDFDRCLTHFTGYVDEADALAFLSFSRNLSGELELKDIKDITIFPVAMPGGSRTATANVTFTIAGEKGADQMQLKEVDGAWKILWEQEPPISAYQLTHSPEDAEYLLSWDFIISQCPEIGEYDRQEAFVRRGESKQFSSGEVFSVELNSPAAWASTRFVRTEWQGETFRSFGITIVYFETDEELDEYLQMDDIKYGLLQCTPIQKEGDFGTAAIEGETPLQTIQLLLAGKHFAIMLMEYATPNESLFLNKDALIELLSTIRTNITALEITPLPSGIPGRLS